LHAWNQLQLAWLPSLKITILLLKYLSALSLSSVAEFAAVSSIDGPGIVGMNLAETNTQDKQKSSQGTPDKMGAGTAAGITFGVTAFVGLAIAAMVIGWRRHKSVHRDSSGLMEPLNSRIGYGTTNDESSPRV